MEATRGISLEGVRADGWFERLADGNANFRQLCEVMGERFVAFSVIAGVRVTAIAVDRRVPDASLVDFVLGDSEEEQRLPLVEFRRRLASAIVADDDPQATVPDLEGLDSDAIHEIIGFRYVLLAPLFGLTLERLNVDVEGAPSVVVRAAGLVEELPLRGFREVIRARVRAEAQRQAGSAPFSIDLAVVPEAESALAENDYEEVIRLLGAWPGPLSILLRTAEGQALSPEVRASLARSLGLLGTSYAKTGRHEWAEEVLRLGIQWGQDGGAVGDLFRRLGENCVDTGRHGEAIGLLRRALALGAPTREVLPSLAVAYADRKKWVAAALCAEESLALAVDETRMRELLDEARVALGPPWDAFRERVPAARAAAITIPAPPKEG